jgi:hypothetical protein
MRRAESYEERRGELIGTLSIAGPGGSQELELSPGAIHRILGVIAAEVVDTARRNANAARSALEDASNEALLKQADQTLQLAGVPTDAAGDF